MGNTSVRPRGRSAGQKLSGEARQLIESDIRLGVEGDRALAQKHHVDHKTIAYHRRRLWGERLDGLRVGEGSTWSADSWLPDLGDQDTVTFELRAIWPARTGRQGRRVEWEVWGELPGEDVRDARPATGGLPAGVERLAQAIAKRLADDWRREYGPGARSAGLWPDLKE
jgi:hypothetical protein